MNFIQRIKTGRLFHRHQEPDIIIKFTFMDKTYILEAFDMCFNQEINNKGQPGGLPRGGIMLLTFADATDFYLNEWITRGDLPREGTIRFLPNRHKINEGAMLIISFSDAHCIQYEKKIRTLEGGLSTTIVVSPRYVKIGNEAFENKWKNEERLSHCIRSN